MLIRTRNAEMSCIELSKYIIVQGGMSRKLEIWHNIFHVSIHDAANSSDVAVYCVVCWCGDRRGYSAAVELGCFTGMVVYFGGDDNW